MLSVASVLQRQTGELLPQRPRLLRRAVGVPRTTATQSHSITESRSCCPGRFCLSLQSHSPLTVEQGNRASCAAVPRNGGVDSVVIKLDGKALNLLCRDYRVRQHYQIEHSSHYYEVTGN